MFKYKLPDACPEIMKRKHREGEYNTRYYRITKNNPPDKDDFLPQWFLDFFKKRREKCKKDVYKRCKMAGLSLLKNKGEAIRLMIKFPALGNFLFSGIISHHHGLLFETPGTEPSHHTFYAYSEVDEVQIFQKREK